VLFLTDLKQSIPSLLSLIGTYGSFSGYKVNESKSTILFLKESERLTPPLNTPFRNIVDSFTYLAVKIPPTIEYMIPTNYNPVTASVVESINRWKSLPISMIGHFTILKMNILPRFLYDFQTIPLAPPSNFFKKMKQLFCNFIWNNRRSRLCMTLLCLSYARGGLKLPYLQGYYWAAQLRAATYWFDVQTQSITALCLCNVRGKKQ